MKHLETDRLKQITAMQGKWICQRGVWKKVSPEGLIWTAYGAIQLRNYTAAQIQVLYETLRDQKPEV